MATLSHSSPPPPVWLRTSTRRGRIRRRTSRRLLLIPVWAWLILPFILAPVRGWETYVPIPSPGDFVMLIPDRDGRERAVPLFESATFGAPWKSGFVLTRTIEAWPSWSQSNPLFLPHLYYDEHFELRSPGQQAVNQPIYATEKDRERFERAYDDLLRDRGDRPEVDAALVLASPRQIPQPGDKEFGHVIWSSLRQRTRMPWNAAVLVATLASNPCRLMFLVSLVSLCFPSRSEREAARWQRGLCPRCAYPRPPLPNAVCPECGMRFDSSGTPTPMPPTDPSATPSA